ncbi:MAG: WYL domain-containing protein [Lachnospiraceae bacterium]|nr:WYL domain-containing protein [Lachnospiraceae bacterium]
MAKSSGQKLKILYILKILMEKSDESHPITTKQLIQELEAYGLSAERKSIYDDIAALNDFGIDVIQVSEKPGGYYIGERNFELAELKLLVDAVQASKFITTKKSRELIHKLESLTSKENAKQLNRQVVVTGRSKAVNEKIYYNVDMIYMALAGGVKIRFHYFAWTVEKTMELKNNGDFYEVSPFLLFWDDENYYLIAYDAKAGFIKHFRVDKMLDIFITQEKRDGLELFQHFDVGEYSKKTFGMFAGEEEIVTLLCDNSLIGVMIDRFGQEVSIRKKDDSTFLLRIKVAVSGQFFGWLAGLGIKVKIQSPERVANAYREYLKKIIQKYDIG